jgi:glycogen synthase
MRVLMVSQFYPPVAGGQEQHVRNLSLALVARGHTVDVITIATDSVPGAALDEGVRLHRVRTSAQHFPWLYSDATRPHAMPVVDPALRRAVGDLLARGGFDVVHAHDWSLMSALGPARRARVPVVLTQHEYSHVCATKRLMRGRDVCPGPELIACLRCAASWHGSLVGPVVAAANALAWRSRTRHVDAFVPVSSVVATNTRLPGRSPYTVIPNFIPDALVPDEVVPDPDGPIVFVGDLSRDKGIEVLLEAHRRLEARRPLVLVGRVLDETPRDLADDVDLRGLLDHAAVIDLMGTAGVVVVPSLVLDCCPTVALEAMALGRPLVAAASGGIVDLLDDGVTGLLVPPGDPIALSKALSTVLDDPQRASAMGQAAHTRARSFTASSVVGRIEELYSALVAGRPPVAAPHAGDKGLASPVASASHRADRSGRA